MANACNYILSPSNAERDVLAALKAGAFYASSGLELHAVHEYKGHIAVSMPRHCTGRFIGPGGAVLSRQTGVVFEYSVKDEPYVRFEAEHNGRKMWLQPFFHRK